MKFYQRNGLRINKCIEKRNYFTRCINRLHITSISSSPNSSTHPDYSVIFTLISATVSYCSTSKTWDEFPRMCNCMLIICFNRNCNEIQAKQKHQINFVIQSSVHSMYHTCWYTGALSNINSTENLGWINCSNEKTSLYYKNTNGILLILRWNSVFFTKLLNGIEWLWKKWY